MTTTPRPPAFDPMTVPTRIGTRYPPEHAAACAARIKRRLGDHGGLRNFGVNHVTLPPGSASALRHWHSREDEFVMVLSGELTLVTDAGEQVLGPGVCAAFPAGKTDGHALVNRSPAEATYLEVGDRVDGDEVDYPDIDMQVRYVAGDYVFVRRSDGARY